MSPPVEPPGVHSGSKKLRPSCDRSGMVGTVDGVGVTGSDVASFTVCYQVGVDLRGDTAVTYQWPQPGLRAAHDNGAQPVTGVDESHMGDLPHAPRRTVR
ncbi:hypothetical protein [Streptomyces sp. NPDC099088]|uniref:hypothetical protein n=1 Tax=Streptomyces sp. NPDC099088 TaxID=3366101 RepID=UPI0037FEE6C6